MFRAVALKFNARLAHRRDIKAGIVQNANTANVRAKVTMPETFQIRNRRPVFGPCLDRVWTVPGTSAEDGATDKGKGKE